MLKNMAKCSTGAVFRAVGLSTGKRPWTWIAGSFVVAIGLSMGALVRVDENRPEKMWVPEGSPAIEHKDYVNDNWPADAGVEMYIATCPTGTSNCNMLEPARLKEVFEGHIIFYSGLVDGTQLADEMKDDYKVVEGDAATNLNERYGGKKWVYDKNLYPGSDPGPLHSKCSLMNENMCDTTNIFWSIFDGDRVTGAHPKNPTFFDNNFVTLQQVLDQINAYAPDKMRGQSVLPSFLGNITRNATGHIVGASHIFNMWGVTFLFVRDTKNDRTDLVNLELEYHGLCGLGVDPEVPNESCSAVPTLDNIEMYPFFLRSMPDAFQADIQGDLMKFIIVYAMIVIYLILQLGKRDSVHSMMGLAFVSILIVACSTQAGAGLCFLFGLKYNNLVQILWFLILGLGVDDTFVIVNEFTRTTQQNPNMSIAKRISLTAETAGHSILVTSFTDALAFLVGALTILPGLRTFCIFAGVAVIFCFIFQLTILLPCLAINAKRAEANRFDVLCCMKAKVQHVINEPRGCCGIPGKPYILEKLFERYSRFILKTPVRCVVIAISLCLLSVGIVGLTQFEMDFNIEWFVPDDNRVQNFIAENNSVFGQSSRTTIYIPEGVDHYAERANVAAVGAYLDSSEILQPGQSISWAKTFEDYQLSNPQDVTTAANYYTALHTWIQGPGSRFERMIQWHDSTDPTKGVKDSKMLATLKAEYTQSGLQRYETLVLFRKEVDQLVPGAFPYSFVFLFWEEAGIMMQELVRNLLLAGGCIFVVIFTLIWDIKISLLVCFGLLCSIAEVIGFAHFWGVTANGTSVIFILLCVGLAVDYSAHVAHMFRISSGTAAERSTAALMRIGPSVFNALISTLLAVCVLGFADSYVFRVFFKILCLTSILAGAQGLVCLPVLLSLFGGSSDPTVSTEEAKKNDEVAQV